MTDAPVRQRVWPAVNTDTRFFWDGVAQGELRVQQCLSCATLIHPPSPACHRCTSLDLGYHVASGNGIVYSWVVFRHPLAPPFTEPYAVAVIELDTGTRLVSQLVDVPLDQIWIGLPVSVRFIEVEPGLTLPLFGPRAA